MKEIWIFMSYLDESKDYPLNPYQMKVFDDFDEMKEYSATHSEVHRKYFKEYCSTYIKTEL